MVECPACRGSYVTNTVFCPECGLYLLEGEEINTVPLGSGTAHPDPGNTAKSGSSGTGLLTIRLSIHTPRSPTAPLGRQSPFRLARPNLPRSPDLWEESDACVGFGCGGAGARQLEVPLTKPIRLGRIDPRQGVYPDVDLTNDLAMEYGVSREHACIFRRGNAVELEDLGSTNGTLLNGARLAPYLPVPLKDGDQLQLGRLLIEVSLGASPRGAGTTTTEVCVPPGAVSRDSAPAERLS
jgi:hypothetical protein